MYASIHFRLDIDNLFLVEWELAKNAYFQVVVVEGWFVHGLCMYVHKF